MFLILETQLFTSPNKHGLSNEPPKKKLASQLQNKNSIQDEIHLRRLTSKKSRKTQLKITKLNWK